MYNFLLEIAWSRILNIHIVVLPAYDTAITVHSNFLSRQTPLWSGMLCFVVQVPKPLCAVESCTTLGLTECHQPFMSVNMTCSSISRCKIVCLQNLFFPLYYSAFPFRLYPEYQFLILFVLIFQVFSFIYITHRCQRQFIKMYTVNCSIPIKEYSWPLNSWD